MPYVGSEVDRVKRYHIEQISGNDTINMILLLLDKNYRKQVCNLIIQNVLYNHRIRPALREIQIEHGFKLQEFNDLIWEAFSCFDNAS